MILAARDLARVRAFYRDLLGWQLEVDSPVYAELRAANGMRLGVYDEHAFARNLGRAPGAPATPARTELYLRCADLEDAVARAIGAGAQLVSPAAPRDWGDEVAYLLDLEGNVVALARPIAAR